HPWTTGQSAATGSGGVLRPADSTDGLTTAIAGLDFSRRKVARERTLLSAINEVKLERTIAPRDEGGAEVRVWDKNRGAHFGQTGGLPSPGQQEKANQAVKGAKERGPADERDVEEFAELGGRGDEVLFAEGGADLSRYAGSTMKAGTPGQ
ncbi:serine/threonine protein kinase, partial [Teratosphaeriaceae sp. CCFEE 6253]